MLLSNTPKILMKNPMGCYSVLPGDRLENTSGSYHELYIGFMMSMSKHFDHHKINFPVKKVINLYDEVYSPLFSDGSG